MTLVDSNYLESISFQHWAGISKTNQIPFSFTAFGDFFLFSIETQLVSLFEPQFNRLSEIEIDLNTFFNGFVVNDGILSDLLRKDYVSVIGNCSQKLEYGECYILTPWRMFGGSDKPDNYRAGDFATYIDLVGQTHQKNGI